MTNLLRCRAAVKRQMFSIAFSLITPIPLTILTLLLTTILYTLYHSTQPITKGLIKRPPSQLLLGHAKHLVPTALLQSLQQFRVQYGPTYELFIFNGLCLVFHDPEVIKEVTIKRPKLFRRDTAAERPAKVMGLVPSSLFFAEGHSWSRLRRLMSTPFNRNNSDAMASSVFIEVKNLIQRLQSRHNEIMNPNKEMMQFTLQVILRTAMGNFPHNEYIKSGEFASDTNAIFDYFMERIFYPDILWQFISPFSNLEKRAFQAKDRMENLVNAVLEHSKDEHVAKSFLGILKAESKSDDGAQSKLSHDEVVANIKTMILAGSETTSVVLSWCVYFLSQYPQYLERLRKEAEILPSLDEPENHQHRYDLPFSAACFKEAMRLRSPAPFIVTEVVGNEPVTLSSGVVVQPNVTMILHFEGVHYNEEFFPNPTLYNPLRWLESDQITMEKMQLNTFLFGYGSRICPGMHLAQHEGELALAYLAKYFDFELMCKPDEVIRIQAFTARPTYLPMKFISRK